MSRLFQFGVLAMLMRADDADEGGYGYGEDTDQKVAPFNFGLNAGVTRLKEFKYIPNGGKEGAEQDALNIIFTINDKDVSYRQFPVVKAFKSQKDGGGETTDPNSPEMKQAKADFSAIVTHILHAFVEDAAVKKAFARPIKDFKEYVNIASSLLPKNFNEIPLDIFMQYQWSVRGEQKRTFLEIPTKRKHGSFLVKAVKPVGEWKAVKVENPDDGKVDALKYVDDAGNVHSFVRTGWFMKSNFANQLRLDSNTEDTDTAGAEAMNSGTTDTPATDAGTTATSW